MSHHQLGLLTAIIGATVGLSGAAGDAPIQPGGLGIVTLHASPSVESTILTTDDALRMLVLWRGSPGWANGARRDAGGGGSADEFRVGITRGAKSLDIWVSRRQQQVRLLDGKAEHLPAETNVLLIDMVDAPARAAIFRKLSVDFGGANFDPRKGSIAPLLRASPKVVEFLRCDVNAPQPAGAMSGDAKTFALALSRGFCDHLRD